MATLKQTCQATLTIFYLFSQTHVETPNLTVFGKNISEMKCYLVEYSGDSVGNAWCFVGTFCHILAMIS